MPPAYEILLLNTAVPQIQAAQAGDTYVVPRDIAVNAALSVTGNTTLGDASTDTVQVNGYMGVGGAASGAYNILARGSTTSGSNQYSIGSTAVLSGTTNSAAFLAGNSIADSVAVTNASGARILNLTLGTSASITSQHGIRIEDLTSGTNNFGITSLVSSGTNKWNIYASGTAANYFAGNVGIGTTTPDKLLHLAGNDTAVIRLENTDTTLTTDQVIGALEFEKQDASGGGVGVVGGMRMLSADSTGTNSKLLFDIARTSTNNVNVFTLDVDGAVFNDPGADYDFRVESDTNTHALFVEGTNSNVKIGGSAERATTVGTNHLDIFNGTAPVGTLANGISIYSSSGEAYVMDAAGNATLFSPHDAETNEWIFKSKHTPSGKVLKIDVEKMLRFINDHFGLDAIHEFTEE